MRSGPGSGGWSRGPGQTLQAEELLFTTLRWLYKMLLKYLWLESCGDY